MKLRDMSSAMISCRIFVLFQFQGVSYHRMMLRRIDVYRLINNIDIVLTSCGTIIKMIGSATRYKFQGMYRFGMINGRQYEYDETA